jgi:methylenetetrahydrofolate reductase (NADPH)
MASPTISFEFFPPKTEEGLKGLLDTAKILQAHKPSFMTVTYGAGGGTRDKTLETALAVNKAGNGCPTATHMTYINTPRKEIYALSDHLWESGIRHIVALRGDLTSDLNWPLDPDKEYFQYTSHFVVALKARHDFEISVGAYPEKHPDAPDFQSDIDALKKKCLAGANRAITQFFFTNDNYYRFLDETAKAGITTPIVPGVLPIANYKKMLGFAGLCKAHVPDELKAKFEGADEADHGKIAEDILLNQLADLQKNGVKHFHFYTLNRADLVSAALKNF